jgi:hypothetical protein
MIKKQHDHTRLKQLQRLIGEAEKTAEKLTEERDAINQKLEGQLSLIANSKQELARLSQRIVVSEHAILRYLERVRGIDLDDIKKEILPEHVEAQVRTLGNGTYPVGQTHKARVQNNVITTVTANQSDN